MKRGIGLEGAGIGLFDFLCITPRQGVSRLTAKIEALPLALHTA
jgi:hypothetical protein